MERFAWLTIFLCVPVDAWVPPNSVKKSTRNLQMDFLPQRSRSSPTADPKYGSLQLRLQQSRSSNENNANPGDDENSGDYDRMQVVRSLQATFYKQTTNNDDSSSLSPQLDLSTGTFHNLPLWRVQWNEVPGRSNVLNVHEGIYTNMFETILHQSPPWYVGHLYLPNGSRNIKSKDRRHKLCSWNDRVAMDEDDNASSKTEAQWENESAVVGTILRIADYRRMVDGRLLLLVQAMERFVVANAQQEVPYSVADVQIIPDTEEIEESDWRQHRTEEDVFAARALAVQESFERWHRYEYENTVLPLPMEADLDPHEVMGSALAKVLPYSPFSSVVQVAKLRGESLKDPTITSKQANREKKRPSKSDFDNQTTLEERLVQGHILTEPCLDPALEALSIDELEVQLWLALNDFLKNTRTPVSPILLGLLPVGRKWPRDFLLERIADAVQEQTQLDHKYVRVSPDYPALRRQKRLSYSAAALLENPQSTNVSAWRRQLLTIPSTKDRLAFVLQRFQTEYGAFQ